MQHTPSEIKEKLLKAVDKEYNVLDMGTVVEVISILERTPITKEALESTRLGKYVNELRRRTTNESLARRAKELVRQWRHLIVQTDNTMCATGQQGSTPNHLRNGLTTPGRVGGGTLSPGLPSRGSTSVLPKTSVSPPFSSGSGVCPHIPTVSPAVSLASSEKSSSPSLQIQQSSSHTRHNSKKQSVCPSTPPVTHNSQTKTPKVHRPESPNVTYSQVNQVLASESVPKTHVANKRLRKDTSPPEVPSKKLGHPNGAIVSNSPTRPNIEVIEECSRDSFGATSDHGSVTWESSGPLKNEVPQDNGLNVNLKSKSQGRRNKRLVSKGAKVKTVATDTSSATSTSDDIVKEKMASIARIPKVKTTQELLAGLQARTVPPEELSSVNSLHTEKKASLTNCILSNKRGSPSDALEISRNKTEHIAKFLRSQSELQVNRGEQSASELPRNFKECLPHSSHVSAVECAELSRISKEVHPPNHVYDNFEPSKSMLGAHPGEDDCAEKVVNDILSRLPPINYDEVEWDEPQEVGKNVSSEETERLLERSYTENIEGICGNLSHEVNSVTFREWHETVIRPSYQGDLLTILPYVVID